MRTIHLHGALRRFGRSFRLSIKSPAEAVRALCLQIPEMRREIKDGIYRVVAGAPHRRRDRCEDELSAGFTGALHIIPVVAGASGGRGLGIGLTIAGAALLAAAFAPAALGLGALGATTIFGISAGTVGLFGASLAITGISTLLAPKPRLDGGLTSPSNTRMESFMFGGAPDRPVSGRRVPVIFGTFRVQCIPISVQLKNVRVSLRNASRHEA